MTPLRRTGPQQPGRILLVIPPLIEFCLDVAPTLCGQPSQYWGGASEVFREAKPLGLYLLQWHPSAFFGASLVDAVFFSTDVLRLPEGAALWISLRLVIAHTWGANSWLLWQTPWGVEGIA